MPFWTTSQQTATADPKRKFRFYVTCTALGGMMWWAKTAAKPSFAIAATEHKYLNHTFYYPGSVTWNDVAITMVDPGAGTAVAASDGLLGADPSDVAMGLSKLIEAAGYTIPTNMDTGSGLVTMTKGKAVGALGSVAIRQINGNGDIVEGWTLHNAWITDLKFGDLEYGSDDITELSMTLKYDWAELTDGSTQAFVRGSRSAVEK
jgi:hypothetical protein